MTTDTILVMTPAELREAIAKKKGYECKSVLPDWPSNIGEAWELVAEMPAVQIEKWISCDKWCCGFGVRDSDGNPKKFATAPTAALAISRAWLMWKEAGWWNG